MSTIRAIFFDFLKDRKAGARGRESRAQSGEVGPTQQREFFLAWFGACAARAPHAATKTSQGCLPRACLLMLVASCGMVTGGLRGCAKKK